MSSPHIAGAGALIKALHPDWTPGQIKSALMTTAWTRWSRKTARPRPTRLTDGSGRVDLNKAGDPGLTFSASALDYARSRDNLWNANYPSVYVPALPGAITIQRTAHSVLGAASQWTLEVKQVGERLHRDRATDPLRFRRAATRRSTLSSTAAMCRSVRSGWRRCTSRRAAEDASYTSRSPSSARSRWSRLTKSCSPATVPQGETTNCTITADQQLSSCRPSASTTNCPQVSRWCPAV